MKLNIIIAFVCSCLTFNVLAQQGSEKKTFYEINERTDFYEVNRRYEIISDTIFYSFAGFLVDAEYDTIRINNIMYVVVTYPNFNRNRQSARQDFLELDEILYDIEEIRINGVRVPIIGKNDKILIIEKDKFDVLSKNTLFDTKWKSSKNYKFTSGLLTVPFKLRPAQDSLNFKMTTDVTIGPHIGITKRISKRNNYYVTLPGTLGLSFINLNNNTTTIQNDNNIDVIPGFTWSLGLILQFDKFTIGYVLGRDYASGVGRDWLYQGKLWHSFAIGYSFLRPEE